MPRARELALRFLVASRRADRADGWANDCEDRAKQEEKTCQIADAHSLSVGARRSRALSNPHMLAPMEGDNHLDGVQPRCQSCRVVMRDAPGAYICPACGEQDPIPPVALPVFHGPTMYGG